MCAFLQHLLLRFIHGPPIRILEGNAVTVKYKRFGKYILLEKLASGGMAEVYLAGSLGAEGISKFFAVKHILPEFSDNENFIRMFKDEAKITVNLNHSNIVPVFEFGVEDGLFYLVMDFVEGSNLKDFLRVLEKAHKRLSTEQIVYICKEIAKGLDHAHRCLDGSTGKPLSIIHRDISPQNVMISFEGEVKIIDFGIAKAESQIEKTQSGNLKGKFSYMSPEQTEGHDLDLRTDIFSLGILMWELLANNRLFASKTEIDTIRKVRECQVPSLTEINPNISPELERIVQKTLNKDRHARYQSCSDLSRDLNRFLNTQYPDFSMQDFSLFIKSFHSNTILENRKKMVAFSKISLLSKQPTSGDKTNTQTQTSTETEAGRTVHFANLDFSSLDIPSNSKSKTTDPSSASTYRQQGSFTRSSATNSSIPVHKASNKAPVYAFLVALLVLIGTGVLLKFPELSEASGLSKIVHLLPPSVSKFFPVKTQSVQQASRPKQQSPLKNVKSEKKNALIIRTTPPGAEIYMNGKKTPIITPGKVFFEANKSFKISLRKTGFATYERQLSLDINKSLQVSLVSLKQGYINVNILNILPKTKLYINGGEITAPLPIRNYPVPANTPIKVRAENHFSNTFSEQIVSVGVNNKKNVNLFLAKKPEQNQKNIQKLKTRTPSNKPK